MEQPVQRVSNNNDGDDQDALALFEVVEALEREVATSPLAPGGLIALNAERVTNLTALLREFERAVRAHPPDERARVARIRAEEAGAALIVEEARRTAEALLSGKRVDGLREAEVEKILREGRHNGEMLVNAAYTDAEARITETRQRAEVALNHVEAACEQVREEPPSPARRVAAAVGARTSGVLSRLVTRLLGA